MAFIVEMTWGRPHQIIVYGLDDDGELYPENVIDCEGEPDPEYRFFSCRGEIWKHTLDLGFRYGWKPMGTVPAESSCRQWEKLGRFENNYQPEEWGYCKQFQVEDAASLADALQLYLRSVKAGDVDMERPTLPTLLSSSVTRMEEFDLANRNLSVEFLESFIKFLRRGPFTFAWDD
jgi:hypothetical protein